MPHWRPEVLDTHHLHRMYFFFTNLLFVDFLEQTVVLLTVIIPVVVLVAPLLQVPSHSPSTGVSDDDTLNPWKYRSEIFWKFVPFKLYSLALFCNSFTESQKCTNAFITCELLWICCNFRQLGNKLRLVHAGLNKVGEVVLPLVLPLMQSCSITRRTEGHDPSNGLVDVLTNSRQS